jgi:hypothetical protein
MAVVAASFTRSFLGQKTKKAKAVKPKSKTAKKKKRNGKKV